MYSDCNRWRGTYASLEKAVQAGAADMHVNLHVADWMAAQREDKILKTMIEWFSNQKVQDLKHLFGDDAKTEEGMAILWKQKKTNALPGSPLSLPYTSWRAGRSYQFVFPKAHWVAATNGYHRDAGHQGQQWMLYPLQDWFRWPGMATQMQKVISNCERCIQYGGTQAKATIQPIIVTAPLEWLCVDFTNIEMTMELEQPTYMVNILVFCKHFMQHIMAYVALDQTEKTLAKFLWQGYILIFRTLAKLLSDWGANFVLTLSKCCVSSWPYGRLGPHLTMLKPTDKLSEPTKCWCAW